MIEECIEEKVDINKESINDIIQDLNVDIEFMSKELEVLTKKGTTSQEFNEYHRRFLRKIMNRLLLKMISEDLQEAV